MFNQRTMLLLVPAFAAGTAAVAASSALDPVALRIGLDAVAVAALTFMACYVGSTAPREVTESEIIGISDAQTKALQSDRRKPTFDRDTGLYANWYFRLRVEEEIARASRYGHPFTMLRITAEDPQMLEAPRLALKGWLRDVDFAGDLGDKLAALLPNTTREGSAVVIHRLETLAPNLRMDVAQYPVDGATIAQLLGESEWHVSDGMGADSSSAA
jgi:hypothetical protein